MNQYTLLFAIVLLYQILFILLSLRLYMKSGINPYVFKGGDAIQRLTEKAFRIQFLGLTTYLLGLVLWPELYLHTGPLPWLEILVPDWMGIILTIVGASVALGAQVQMGRSWRIGSSKEKTTLVMTGIFSYSRNPVFLGMILMVVGVTAVIPTAVTISHAATATLAIAIQIRIEERNLLQLLGEHYQEYCERVPRWIKFPLP